MKEAVAKILKRFLIIGTPITTVVYLIWRVFFTIPFGFGTFALISGLILLIVEIVGMFESFVHYANMTKVEHPVKPKIRSSRFPDVDVFILTYTEPVDLLFKTINGCLHMDYPNKEKVHIYLCDDGNREEMKDLADLMGIRYLARKDNKDAKAGNLNHALKNSSSPCIVTLDADMIPKHNFLMETVPYFMEKKYVGFVQTPQDFYNPDLFQYNLYSENRIPNEQDYFYHDVQISRNKTNTAIYCGTNTMISRKALEDIGGFVTGVLTEDFATGLAIQNKGYICYATNEICASGLAPTDLKSLTKQRQRWARGCIQSGRKLHFLFSRGLSLKQKLNYFASISYWYAGVKRFVYIVAPILFSVFGVYVVKLTWPEVLIFWLPMYLFSIASLRMLSGNIRSTKWTNIYETILFPALLRAVLMETLYMTQRKFVVTSKVKNDNRRAYTFLQATPHFLLTALSLLGIYRSVVMIITTGSLLHLIVLFWLTVNLYNLIMAIFFMLGRKMFRTSERIRAEVPCQVDDGHRVVNSTTFDLSDTGLSFLTQEPLYFPYNSPCKISLKTERYQCSFQAHIIRVVPRPGNSGRRDQWLYALQIKDIDVDNRKQYYQIIYDRKFDLPKTLDRDYRLVEDMLANVTLRGRKDPGYNRRLPRVTLEKELATAENYTIILDKFNYDYAEVKPFAGKYLPSQLTFLAGNDIKIHCTYAGKRRKKGIRGRIKAGALYYIENGQELAYSENFRALLLEWMEEYERKHAKRAVVSKPAVSPGMSSEG